MLKDVTAYVSSCGMCKQKRRPARQQRHTYVPHRSSFFNYMIFADLIGLFQQNRDGYTYILTITDHFSKWAECVAIKDKQAVTVAKALVQNWVSRFGCPDRLHTDMGSEFTGNVFKEMMKFLGIKCTTTPPYSPWANNAERVNQTVVGILRAISASDDDWPCKLQAAVFAYNTSTHTSTGLMPFMVMFGQKAVLPVNLIVARPEDEYEDDEGLTSSPDANSIFKRFQNMYKREQLKRLQCSVVRIMTIVELRKN